MEVRIDTDPRYIQTGLDTYQDALLLQSDNKIEGGAPKERRRRRAEKHSCPKGCLWRVRFFFATLRFSGHFRCFKSKTLRGQRGNGLSKNTLLDNRFSAHAFAAPLAHSENRRTLSTCHERTVAPDLRPRIHFCGAPFPINLNTPWQIVSRVICS